MLRWVDKWTRRQRVLAALIVTLIAVTLPYVELLFGLKTAMYNDINGAHLPRYEAVWQNLQHGRSPFWWSGILSGHNALGAGQSAIFYLPNVIFGWVPPVTAFRWWFFFHLWLMAAGWFLWSLRRWGSIAGAVVSGVVGVLNGVLVSHFIDTPYIAAIALLPWAMLAFDRVVDLAKRRDIALLALLLAGISFTGHPQLLWLTLVALGVTTVVYVVLRTVDWRTVLRVVSACGLGLALAAAALLPQLRFGRTSVRPKLDKAGAFQYAEEPRHLLTLIAHNIMGGANSAFGWHTPWQAGTQQPEQINYLGIIGLALAVIAVVRLGRDRRSIAFLVVAVFALLTSLGDNTPIGTLAFHVLPFANRFRIWSRNLLLVNLVVASLAGAGVRELLRLPRRWVAPIALGAAALGILMTLLPALTSLGGAMLKGREGLIARLLPVVFLLALLAAVFVAVRDRRLGACAIVVVCLIDLGSFAFSGLWRSQGAPPAESRAIWGDTAPFFGAIVNQPGGLDRWVSDVADSSTLWPSALGRGGPTVNGYDPLMQADYSATVGYMSYNGYLNQPLIWSGGWLPDVLRTTTLVASGYAGAPAPGWNLYGTANGYTLYSYAPRLPENYLVGGVRVGSLDDARAGLSAPDTNLTQYAYVDRNTVSEADLNVIAAAHDPGSAGSVLDGAMDDGGSGTWTVFAERPSLFVTSYAWMEGWHATVDGKPVPVARTNALVLGVPVPAGAHRVHLAFTPPGWTTGRNLSIAALVVVALLFLSDVRRERWMLLVRRIAGDRHRTGPVPNHSAVDHAEHGEEGRLADR
ncbi:MAG: YfhO family protein [Actinobacteria bacterium]|uniref:Unannotated protein n=1 Tax=freshwater metagenome TaxID=449393 RepID=A0A6J7U2I9_9ZZZZ|nr:YfhO family protein [Actinomycetota bacterium]